MKILYSPWMQELDAYTIKHIGIPSIVLMENASRGAAAFFAEQFPLTQYKHAIVIAGKGNNGGDGLAVGRILYQKGYNVHFVLLTAPDKLNPDPKINYNILEKLNLPCTIVPDESHLETISKLLSSFCSHDTFLIDSVFGTGLNQPVTKGFFYGVLRILKDSPFKIASIDIPSGLSEAFLPSSGIHVNAHITATFQALKIAHIYPDGNKYCGLIRIIDIGIPGQLLEKEEYYVRLIEPSHFYSMLGKREIDAHKGSYGHALTICGSIDKPGAGILSSFAVLKAGAGLCTAAVPYENRSIPVSAHPELMTLIINSPDDLLKSLKEFDTFLIGPGLGKNENTTRIVEMIIEKSSVPIVLDADALNCIADFFSSGVSIEILNKNREFPLILTPHPGEFSRLIRRTVSDVLKERISLSREFAMINNVFLVLKGHHTLIATPKGDIFVNPTGNAGMATAGSGDVLSGLIAGMLCQFYPVFPIELILQAAIFIHGYAGDIAVRSVGEISLTATDILRYVPEAILKIHDYTNPFQIG